jgi:hypothetical protein
MAKVKVLYSRIAGFGYTQSSRKMAECGNGRRNLSGIEVFRCEPGKSNRLAGLPKSLTWQHLNDIVEDDHGGKEHQGNEGGLVEPQLNGLIDVSPHGGFDQ